MMPDDNNKKITQRCPFCGKPVREGAEFCDRCSDVIEKRDIDFLSDPVTIETDEAEVPPILPVVEDPTKGVEAQPLVSDDDKSANDVGDNVDIQEDEASDNTPQKRKKRLVSYLVGSFIVLVLGLGTIFGIHYYQNTVKEIEVMFWNQCVEANTPTEYSKYLVRFPGGMYVADAESRIKAFREKEKSDWEQAILANKIDDYTNYLALYPKSPYLQIAKQKMDSISWEETLKASTVDAYRAYLGNVELGNISGAYAIEAQNKLDYLKSLVIIEGKELDSIKTQITKFFVAVSKLKAYDIAHVSLPEIKPYLGHDSANPGMIIDLTKKEIKDKKIKELEYKAILNDISVVKDSTQNYITEIPVLINLKYKDKKKKDISETISTTIELNKEQKIKSIYLKNDRR